MGMGQPVQPVQPQYGNAMGGERFSGGQAMTPPPPQGKGGPAGGTGLNPMPEYQQPYYQQQAMPDSQRQRPMPEYQQPYYQRMAGPQIQNAADQMQSDMQGMGQPSSSPMQYGLPQTPPPSTGGKGGDGAGSRPAPSGKGGGG